jgi:alginate O-acetyltransferase complex protein AlgI
MPITLIVYLSLKKEIQNIWLLLCSLFFYFWGSLQFVLIMLASICINYLFGLLIGFTWNKRISVRGMILSAAVILNLSILFWYKYLDFTIELLNLAFHASIPLMNIPLPIGISFFTFQGLTYIIDVYRKIVYPQKNPLKVALYISLFPQLIAGPIVRYKDIATQINDRKETFEAFYQGMFRFIIGLGKKVIIANNIAVIADNIFVLPAGTHSASIAWLGIICYTLQIYFDFSGYSDMAIGLGRMFGFSFPENFNYPYISASIREFWRRWHISLSTFFRDYLYIPLGGNRRGNVYANLLIVFLATGLWHGASVNFVLWGFWHGAFIITERVLSKNALIHRLPPPPNEINFLLTHVYTLSVILIGWVLFRSENIAYAVSYFKSMFFFIDGLKAKVSVLFYLDSFNLFILVLAILFCTPVTLKLRRLILFRFSQTGSEFVLISVQVVSSVCILLISCVMILNSNYNPFIYFRF